MERTSTRLELFECLSLSRASATEKLLSDARTFWDSAEKTENHAQGRRLWTCGVAEVGPGFKNNEARTDYSAKPVLTSDMYIAGLKFQRFTW